MPNPTRLYASLMPHRVLTERKETLVQTITMATQVCWIDSIHLILRFCLALFEERQRHPGIVERFVDRRARKRESYEEMNAGLLFVCNSILLNLPSFRGGTTIFTQAVIETLSSLGSRLCRRVLRAQAVGPQRYACGALPSGCPARMGGG